MEENNQNWILFPRLLCDVMWWNFKFDLNSFWSKSLNQKIIFLFILQVPIKVLNLMRRDIIIDISTHCQSIRQSLRTIIQFLSKQLFIVFHNSSLPNLAVQIRRFRPLSDLGKMTMTQESINFSYNEVVWSGGSFSSTLLVTFSWHSEWTQSFIDSYSISSD